MPSRVCLIGRIARAHGVRGMVSVQSYSDHPGRFSLLRTVLIGLDESRAVEYGIVEAREQGGKVMLSFAGVESRSQAEELVGAGVFIREDQMLPPPDGMHYVHDLVGCAVTTPDGADRGTVTDVLLLPGNDVYVVNDHGREVLVPAVPEFISEVDTTAKRVVVLPVPGLFEEKDEN